MCYAHTGSGGMHIYAVADDDFAERSAAFADEVYAKCRTLGGDVRGEYGIGCAKVMYLSAGEAGRFLELKSRFDPKGILNPGKAAK